MELEEAERLDPFSPLISDHQAILFLYLDRLDDAVAAAKRTGVMSPASRSHASSSRSIITMKPFAGSIAP